MCFYKLAEYKSNNKNIWKAVNTVTNKSKEQLVPRSHFLLMH